MKRIWLSLWLNIWALSLSAQQELPYLPTAQPAEVGFKEDSIHNLVQLIRDTPPRDFRSLVVIKDDKLVVEAYFHTFWRNSLHDIRSAGKSITAMLLGIAIDRGLVNSVEDPIYDYLNIDPPTPKHAAMKIKHLLSMTSGLDADSDDPGTPGQAGQWMGLDDWDDYIQKVPMARAPGERWVYADLNSQFIGTIIEKASGMNLSAFAKKQLFGPLDIEEYYWQQNKAGSTVASGNLFMTGLDFAKLGWLVLRQGQFQGKQLISQTYLREMTDKQLSIPEDYFGVPVDYGYLWYTRTRQFAGKEVTYHYASGNGGNYIMVIPGENMVISLMSSAYGPYHGHYRSNLIFQKVMEALK